MTITEARREAERTGMAGRANLIVFQKSGWYDIFAASEEEFIEPWGDEGVHGRRSRQIGEQEMGEETGFIPVREFPDRGTRWLLESLGNVREVVRLVAPDLVDRLDFSRLQQVRATFVSDRLRKQESDLVFLAPWREPQEREVLAQVVLEAVRDRLRREEIEKMGKTIAEALIEEGRELGREEGRELGWQQGILRAKQEDLLRLMRARFGSLAPAVVERIEALDDVNHLDVLLERVLAAASVEEMGIG